uniref:Peptidase S1 domain-containing protein n=1 Tax=Panagrellus redivivus TaxID=6233 RepID=A0A7E4UL80_PANRE
MVRALPLVLLFLSFNNCHSGIIGGLFVEDIANKLVQQVLPRKLVLDPELALPFMACLRGKNREGNSYHMLCSATIIGKRHILTAAHCYYGLFGRHQREASKSRIKRETLEKLRIRVGDTMAGPGEFFEIDKIFLRPRSNYTNYDDIMVVQLKESITFDNLTKGIVKLARNVEPKPGMEYDVAGFGNHTNDGKNFDSPDTYTFNSIKVREDAFCKKFLRKREYCAGGEDQGTMGGDSGGPMYSRVKPRYQVGIIARGATEHKTLGDKAVLLDHGAYTKVAPYCDFIEKVTKGEVKCENVDW